MSIFQIQTMVTCFTNQDIQKMVSSFVQLKQEKTLPLIFNQTVPGKDTIRKLFCCHQSMRLFCRSAYAVYI